MASMQRALALSKLPPSSILDHHDATMSFIIQGLTPLLRLILHTNFQTAYLFPRSFISGIKYTIPTLILLIRFSLPIYISVR